MDKIYVGIDLHKESQTWVGIGEEGNTIIFKKEFEVTPSGVTMALAYVYSQSNNISVVIEPCCGWMWVKKQLEGGGLTVTTTNPRKVRAIADSLQKTDTNDAHTLALLLRTNMLYTSRTLPMETKKLRDLVRERSFFVKERATVKCRLEGIVTREGRHLIKGSLGTKSGITQILASDSLEWKTHIQVIADLTVQIEILEKRLLQESKNIHEVKLLQSIPGIGLITAMTIYAEVGDFKAFDRPEKLAAFAGLVPTERSSGGVQRLGHITHAGSKYLRYILVEAAMHIRNTEKSKKLYDFYENIKSRSGAMRARVALARKMLTIAWYMIKNNEPYRNTIK